MHVSDIPLDKNCQVIEYHDSGIWILDKAPGVLSHPNEKKSINFKQKTLLRADYCMQTEKIYLGFRFWYTRILFMSPFRFTNLWDYNWLQQRKYCHRIRTPFLKEGSRKLFSCHSRI